MLRPYTLGLLAAAGMAACGGGAADPAGNAPDQGVEIRGVTLAAPGPPAGSMVVVRARATLATSWGGPYGAHMQVTVDGQHIGEVVVDNVSVGQDFSFVAPRMLKPGSRVDVAFLNDAVTVVNGVRTEDRNLIVEAVTVDGGPPLRPDDPGVTLDRGFGAAAFDGLDVLPGQSGLWWDGALRFVLDNRSAPATTLKVRARATLAGGIAPRMSVRVDGVPAEPAFVDVTQTGTAQELTFTVARIDPSSRIDLVYTNDGATFVNGRITEDRNLVIESLTVGSGVAIAPTAPGVVLDRGVGLLAFDGRDTLPGQAYLAWNGALRFSLAELDAARQPGTATQGWSTADKERAARLGYLAVEAFQLARARLPGSSATTLGEFLSLRTLPTQFCNRGGQLTASVDGRSLAPGDALPDAGLWSSSYSGPCATVYDPQTSSQLTRPSDQLSGMVSSHARRTISVLREYGIESRTIRDTELVSFAPLRRTETIGAIYTPGLGLQDVSLQGDLVFGSLGRVDVTFRKDLMTSWLTWTGTTLVDHIGGGTARLEGTVVVDELINSSGQVHLRVLPLNLKIRSGPYEFRVHGVSHTNFAMSDQRSEDYTITFEGAKVGRVFSFGTLPRMVEVDGRLTPL